MGRLSIERKPEKWKITYKVSLLKVPFKYFTTVIDMNIVNLGIKVIIFLKKYSMCIEYILGTVIMLETNSHPPTGAVLLFPTFSDDKNC